VKNEEGETKTIVLGRTGEINILDANNGRQLISYNIPYGSDLIMSEFEGVIEYEGISEGVTYREEADEQTGHVEKVVIESRDKSQIPTLVILDKKGVTCR